MIAIDPPNDEATARMNPLGIYVTNASWSRVL
jgi:type IV secretory pathway TrbF-like protein